MKDITFHYTNEQMVKDLLAITPISQYNTAITDFERGVTTPQRRIAEDIKTIFEEAGIKFENDDEGQGTKLLKEFDFE